MRQRRTPDLLAEATQRADRDGEATDVAYHRDSAAGVGVGYRGQRGGNAGEDLVAGFAVGTLAVRSLRMTHACSTRAVNAAVSGSRLPSSSPTPNSTSDGMLTTSIPSWPARTWAVCCARVAVLA